MMARVPAFRKPAMMRARRICAEIERLNSIVDHLGRSGARKLGQAV
jgi:hypothetical protein